MTISCTEALGLLERYCDRELADEQRRRVAEHLEMCEECPKKEDFLLRLKDLVRRKCCGLAELPPDLADRLLRLIRSD